MRLQVQPGGSAGFGVGGGQRQCGQCVGFNDQGIDRLRPAPALPFAQPGALGVQGLATRAQRVAQGRGAQGRGAHAPQRGVDGLQVVLEFGNATGGQRGLGLVHQVVDALIEPAKLFGAVVQRGSDRCCDRCGLGRCQVHRHRHRRRRKFALTRFFSTGGGLLRRLDRGLQGLVERGGGRHLGARRAQRRGGFAAPGDGVGILRNAGLQRRQ